MPAAPERAPRRRALRADEGARAQRGDGSLTPDGDARFATRFALAALATWRVTHLIAEEDGPGNLVISARARLGTSLAGELMDCFYCLSVWVAAPLTLTVTRRPRAAVGTWLALSGAACLLERATEEPT